MVKFSKIDQKELTTKHAHAMTKKESSNTASKIESQEKFCPQKARHNLVIFQCGKANTQKNKFLK